VKVGLVESGTTGLRWNGVIRLSNRSDFTLADSY
jgi:hypothetical protein